MNVQQEIIPVQGLRIVQMLLEVIIVLVKMGALVLVFFFSFFLFFLNKS